MTASTRIVGYTRVSTKAQASPVSTSLQWQEQQIRAYADRIHGTVEKVFTDVASGARLENLKWLQQLLEYCEAHPADGGEVVVAMYDRLGRFSDYGTYREINRRLEKAGWVLTALDINEDEDGPMVAHILIGMLEAAAVGDPERLQRAHRVIEAYSDDPKGLWSYVTDVLGGALDRMPDEKEQSA